MAARRRCSSPMPAERILSNQYCHVAHPLLLKHSDGALYSHESSGSCPSGLSVLCLLRDGFRLSATRRCSAYCLSFKRIVSEVYSLPNTK